MTPYHDAARQLAELQAVEAVYAEQLRMSGEEKATRELLQQACDAADAGGADTTAVLAPHELAASAQLSCARVGGQPVSVHFQLPPDYPAVAPRLRLDCAGPSDQGARAQSRGIVDELTAQLQHAALDNAGEESLLVCLSQAEEIVAEAIAAGRLHAQHAVEDVSRQQHQQQEEAQRQAVGCALMHVVIWFHHIKAPKKRKHIADWSRELRIGGFAKVGYPGVIVAEGLQPDVEDFVARLRSQQWKAMAVRGEHTVRCPTQAEAEGKRHFAAGKVGELADGQLGVLGEHCRAAGLEGLFLTALKIDKG